MPEQEYSLGALATCAEREARMRRQVYQSRANKATGGPRALSVAEVSEIRMMEAISKLLREAEADLASLSAPPAPPQVFAPACPRCCQRPDACIC